MYSKSFFSSNSTNIPSMINPLGVSSSQTKTNILSIEAINAIKTIQQYYTFNMASKNYSLIPNDYEKLLRLYNTVSLSYYKVSNSTIKTLLKITQEGLIGAMNTYSLYFTNNELSIENKILQSKIEEILSGVNKITALSSSTGHLTITKSFVLAPLFSYYINLFGMPQRGIGFDQDKISALLSVMDKYGIDPYK
jgi:hypothetical protein